ncbi:BCCT family transporter [Candidatus Poribacteria bacterium]|nr:BCCT family transporter [Candidatus Poribacteria bacterium]
MESVETGAYAAALFEMFAKLPLAQLTSFVSIVLLITFFVTTSDSGSLVVDTITAGGKMEAPARQRVFWCSVEGLVAIALLLGGGLRSLQAATLVSGLPFAFIIIGIGICTWIALRQASR